MPESGSTFSLPTSSAVFSGKRIAGSARGGAQILRDMPRFMRLAETGQLRLEAMVSNRIKLDEINHGIALLERAEGTRTVII